MALNKATQQDMLCSVMGDIADAIHASRKPPQDPEDVSAIQDMIERAVAVRDKGYKSNLASMQQLQVDAMALALVIKGKK